jgi:hypothetical protein
MVHSTTILTYGLSTNDRKKDGFLRLIVFTIVKITSTDKEIYIFVLIYNWQSKWKKLVSQKKGFPLEPRFVGMCTFSTQKFEKRACMIWDRLVGFCLFFTRTYSTTIWELRFIQIHSHAIQPTPFSTQPPKVGFLIALGGVSFGELFGNFEYWWRTRVRCVWIQSFIFISFLSRNFAKFLHKFAHP